MLRDVETSLSGRKKSKKSNWKNHEKIEEIEEIEFFEAAAVGETG